MCPGASRIQHDIFCVNSGTAGRFQGLLLLEKKGAYGLNLYWDIRDLLQAADRMGSVQERNPNPGEKSAVRYVRPCRKEIPVDPGIRRGWKETRPFSKITFCPVDVS